MTIRLRITLATILVVLTIVGIFTVNGYVARQAADDRYTRSYLNAKQVLWQQILARHASEMRAFTKSMTRDRTSLKAIRSGDISTLQEQVNTTHNLFMADGTLDRVQVLDTDGAYLASAPQKFSGKTQKAIVNDVARDGTVLYSTARDDDGVLQAALAFPLYARGKLKAVVVYSRDLQRLLDDFQEGNNSDVYISDASGQTTHKGTGNTLNERPTFDGPMSEGQLHVSQSEGRFLVNAAVPLVDHGGQTIAGLLASQDQTESFVAQNRARNISYGLVLATTVLAIFGLYWFFRSAFKPIDGVIVAMEDISSGNLQCNVPAATAGTETGRLTKGLCGMVEQLRELLGRITTTTDELKTSAEQLNQAAISGSASVTEQRNETDQVATAINELAATVQEVAQSAADAANAATDADRDANEGRMVIEKTIVAIENLAGEIHNAAAVVLALREDSVHIETVLDVIKNIAEQTNLLALNAAIEAARAGEQGRGFAVVADEVRTLASRTHDSTKEIEDMITNLQSGVSNAVQVMEKSELGSNATVQEATHARETLVSITNAVSRINAMNAQIATAAAEQSTVAELISQSVVKIAQTAVEAEETIGSTSASSKRLVTAGDELQKLVHRFHL